MKKSYVKTKIMDALNTLMTKKAYLDITVSDIVRCAEISRASFYRNYSSIDDVLDEILYLLKEEISEKVSPALFSNNKKEYYSYIKEFLTLIKDSKVPFHNILLENRQIIGNKLDKSFKKHMVENDNDFNTKYKLVVNSSIIIAVARTWSSLGFKEDIEFMSDYICKILL